MNIDNVTLKAGKPLTKSANHFPVVGIGASAGGLDAFRKLIKGIPENSGMAYVLVQHLDPSHESLLPELLQRATRIPVLEISDNLKVLPDHIYIVPSNKMLIANDGVLQLSARPAKDKNVHNMPVDLFFTSLAEVHQAHAIGVILSGTATDGTIGLKAIKDNGGVTFAQDESAAYDGMPHNATQAGVVDFVLPPDKIPGKILEITKTYTRNELDDENFGAEDEEVYREILAVLRAYKGTDFTYYKQTTIRRRILRRMALNLKEELTEYLKILETNKLEQDVLYQDLLIPVTSFFRDQKVFDNLRQSVFPNLIKNKRSGDSIRMWVAGCSTGEEAYSLAICMKTFLSTSSKVDVNEKGVKLSDLRVQIFATDISEPAIAKARAGTYAKNETDGLSPQQLEEYFTVINGSYQVSKAIRDICVFATHNFLKDPPFGKLDFISCRNVLIYMEPYLQKKALTIFHYALNLKGTLLLGRAEFNGNAPDMFVCARKNDNVFTRKDMHTRFMHVITQRSEQNFRELNVNPKPEKNETDFQKTADQILLSKFTPASVVVNESLDIVHFRGNTGDFLEQGPGKPSHNVLKMARDGLAFELRNTLHKAQKENRGVVKENIPVFINGSKRHITIEAIPLPNIAESHYLITFHDTTDAPGGKPKTYNAKVSSKLTRDEKDLRILQLEQELEQTKNEIRTFNEDQEAANEELQSANEDLLSGSEELQSMNEELESSKEELQSSNEELTVINQEIITLNEQLTESKIYTEAIVATIHEPFLVLDKDLRVKSANRTFYKVFGVKQEDTEGVLIYDLGNKQWDIPGLRTLLAELLPQRKNFTNFEVAHSFPGIGKRIMLFNAFEMSKEKGEEKLILLAMEDITRRKLHENEKIELLLKFQNLVIQAPVAILILKGKDHRVELANDFYLKLVEKEKDFIGRPIFETLPELKEQGIKELLDNVLQTGIPYHGSEVEVQLFRNNIMEKGYFNFVYQPMLEQNKKVSGIIVVATEVTEQIISRRKMEAQAMMVQNLLMTAPGFVCTLTGPNHVYELINERYQQLVGKREIKHKPILEALPELKGQGFDTLLDKVYNTGESYVGIDIPMFLARDENREPELCYFNFSYQPMYDENKQTFSILVFGYEVTEQVIARNKFLDIQQKNAIELEGKVNSRTLELSEANELLQQKNKELIKVNSELSSFTYVSSHDLQEPLRKIKTFSKLIIEKENQNLSAQGKDFFTRMQNAADRMQALIEDLLVYSQTNSTERKFEDTALKPFIEEIVKQHAEALSEKNATMELGNLCNVSIIPFQFRQLFNNLISNSLKFSVPAKPPHIIIKSEIYTADKKNNEGARLLANQLSAGKKYCHISFSDNGIGFNPEYKERIFEIFQRLHGKDEYPGTGIGLSIVQKIVENHNGIITANSELGKGATFDIYIPAL